MGSAELIVWRLEVWMKIHCHRPCGFMVVDARWCHAVSESMGVGAGTQISEGTGERLACWDAAPFPLP